MSDFELKNNIVSAFESAMPEGQFEKITAKIAALPNERVQIKMTKSKNKTKIFVYAAACVAFAFLFGVIYYNFNLKVESKIYIDVNPSIELSVSKNEKVIDVKALNDDALPITNELNLKKTDLYNVIYNIVESVTDNGYLDNETNGILVTVLNDDAQKADELKQEIAADIDAALSENDVSAQVVNQTIVLDDDAVTFANDNYISIGKAVFVLNIVAKDNTLNAVDLAGMNIFELIALVEERNIDISDFCEMSDELLVNIMYEMADIGDELIKENEAVSNEISISTDDAYLAALAHANLKDSEIENVIVEHYKAGYRNIYNVEFRYNGITYVYDIDAQTGEIITCGTDEIDGPEVEIEVPIE